MIVVVYQATTLQVNPVTLMEKSCPLPITWKRSEIVLPMALEGCAMAPFLANHLPALILGMKRVLGSGIMNNEV